MPQTAVINDSKIDRKLMAGWSKSSLSGCEVGAFEDSHGAIKARAADPGCLVMPNMDELSAVREFREAVPQIPVIPMSAYGNKTIVVEAFEAGAASHVPQARQAELLVDTVRKVLTRTDRGRLDCRRGFDRHWAIDWGLPVISPLVGRNDAGALASNSHARRTDASGTGPRSFDRSTF